MRQDIVYRVSDAPNDERRRLSNYLIPGHIPPLLHFFYRVLGELLRVLSRVSAYNSMFGGCGFFQLFQFFGDGP